MERRKRLRRGWRKRREQYLVVLFWAIVVASLFGACRGE